jgi:hypothetical protein
LFLSKIDFIQDFRGALTRLFTCTNDQNAFYRPSLESQYQQRINQMTFNSRNLTQNRMYIDSPLWKREQIALQHKTESENHQENHKVENNETIELQASTLYRIASHQ